MSLQPPHGSLDTVQEGMLLSWRFCTALLTLLISAGAAGIDPRLLAIHTVCPLSPNGEHPFLLNGSFGYVFMHSVRLQDIYT